MDYLNKVVCWFKRQHKWHDWVGHTRWCVRCHAHEFRPFTIIIPKMGQVTSEELVGGE